MCKKLPLPPPAGGQYVKFFLTLTERGYITWTMVPRRPYKILAISAPTFRSQGDIYIPLVPDGANNPWHGLLAKKSKKKVWINQKQSRYNVPIFYVNGDKKP